MYDIRTEYRRPLWPELFKKTRKTPLVYWLLSALGFITVFLIFAILLMQRRDGLQLYFLNVGQGDSELIELAGGVRVLIDGGPDGKRLLENLDVVLPAHERYIDLLIMTHPQLDHFGGFIELLKKYKVGAFVGAMRRGGIAA